MTRAPGPEAIALAFDMAADAHGERGLWLSCPETVLLNRAAVRWRWYALAALRQVWGMTATLEGAPFFRKWGDERSPSQLLSDMERRTWWDGALVDKIAGQLRVSFDQARAA